MFIPLLTKEQYGGLIRTEIDENWGAKVDPLGDPGMAPISDPRVDPLSDP